MVFNFHIPWYVKLPIFITTINFPYFYFYGNPYILHGSLQAMAKKRYISYSFVRTKNQEDVKVHTEESLQFYKDIEDKKFPPPMYSKYPNDEEIKTHELLVLGHTIENVVVEESE